MKLININRLSDSELKYMAEQEGIEDADSLDRTELIENLEEIYGGDASELDVDKKFVKTLIAKETETDALPGVRPLPDKFNDNEIQTILQDSAWAYVIWHISHATKEKILRNENVKIILRVIALKENNKKEESYQVEVGIDDTTWNIEFPWKGRNYEITLNAEIDGVLTTLATSPIETIPNVYVEDHPEILRNPETYKVLSSSLITNGGEYLAVDEVKQILSGNLT